jgi:hypothetical protein
MNEDDAGSSQQPLLLYGIIERTQSLRPEIHLAGLAQQVPRELDLLRPTPLGNKCTRFEKHLMALDEVHQVLLFTVPPSTTY